MIQSRVQNSPHATVQMRAVERVLLVEKDSTPETSLASKLIAAGFRVQCVDVYEGIDRSRINNPPDVVILTPGVDVKEFSNLYTVLGQSLSTLTTAIIQIVENKKTNREFKATMAGSEGSVSSSEHWDEFSLLVHSVGRCNKRLREDYEQEVEQRLTKAARLLSHEVFLPLIEIEATSEFLSQARDNITNDEMSDLLRDISDASRKVHKMLTRMALLKTLESAASQKQRSQGVTPDISFLVEDIARRTAQRHNREKDITIKVESVAVQVPTIDFTQIVEELVDQALCTSNGGDKLSIQGNATEECQLCVAVKTEPSPRIVDDSGEESEDTESSLFSGIDIQLGQGIIRRLASLHGGSYSSKNEEDGSTSSIVTLPIELASVA